MHLKFIFIFTFFLSVQSEIFSQEHQKFLEIQKAIITDMSTNIGLSKLTQKTTLIDSSYYYSDYFMFKYRCPPGWKTVKFDSSSNGFSFSLVNRNYSLPVISIRGLISNTEMEGNLLNYFSFVSVLTSCNAISSTYPTVLLLVDSLYSSQTRQISFCFRFGDQQQSEANGFALNKGRYQYNIHYLTSASDFSTNKKIYLSLADSMSFLSGNVLAKVENNQPTFHNVKLISNIDILGRCITTNFSKLSSGAYVFKNEQFFSDKIYIDQQNKLYIKAKK